MTTMGDLTGQFLRAILPTQKDGWLTGNVGIGGHYNGSGSYEFTSFPSFAYQWPSQEVEAVAHIQQHADSDVFMCPYLQKTPQRRKGGATYRDIVHCDCDKAVDLDKVRQVHGVPLWSGSPGHAHVYAWLTHCVTWAQHEALERGLVAFLDGDKAKINDNDLLRPAGARNHKGQQPTWVLPAVDYASVVPIDPFELARILGIDINAAAPQSNGQTPPAASVDREKVDPIPGPVQDELDIDTNDQSVDSYRVICKCIDCGLSLAQTRWVIDQRPAMAARVAEFFARRPPVDDVLISYTKALNEWQRKQQPVAAAPGIGLGGPQAAAAPSPGPAAAAPPPGPGRFFGRTGFRALDCALEVMAAAVCGYGRPDERFYTYDPGGVWIAGDERIEREITRLLGNRYRPAHTKNVTTIIKHLPGTAQITDSPLAELVNVPNGMVRWSDGAILPHDPAYLSTVQLPVEYVPSALCPQFDKYLSEVLPPDLLAPTADGGLGFIWELIGYTILSGNPHQIAVLLWGKGRNGKGTLIRVIQSLIGEANYSSVTLYELIEDKFARAQLYGKLANLAGDLDSKWLENTATFKKVTGHDSIQGEYKYGAKFNFTPWALPFYSANKPFGSADSSEGWVRRWVVVPFPNCFSGREDRSLEAKLTSEGELRGILAKGIAALPALMARRNFTDLPSLVASREAFVLASDAVRAWLDEHCNLVPGAWLLRDDLFRKYLQHAAADNPKTVLSRQQFYNRIEQIAGVTPSRRNNGRGFTGIEFKTPQTFWTP